MIMMMSYLLFFNAYNYKMCWIKCVQSYSKCFVEQTNVGVCFLKKTAKCSQVLWFILKY